MVELALDAYFAVEYPEMERWGRRALDLASAKGEASLSAVSGAVISLATAMDGRVATARDDCTRAAELVDSLPDEVLAQRLQTFTYLSLAELMIDRHDESSRHASRAVAIARATGQSRSTPVVVPILANLALLRGDLRHGLDLSDDAVEALRLTDYRPGLAWALVTRSAIKLPVGDLDGAMADAEESYQLLGSLEERHLRAWAAIHLAAAWMQAGREREAEDLLAGELQGSEFPDLPGKWRVVGHELLVRCHLATGRLEDAAVHADRAIREADRLDLPLPRVMALRAAAEIALERGEADTALGLAQNSANLARDIGAPLEAALSSTLAGRAARATGQKQEAVEL